MTEVSTCAHCGHFLVAGMSFCDLCGARQEPLEAMGERPVSLRRAPASSRERAPRWRSIRPSPAAVRGTALVAALLLLAAAAVRLGGGAAPAQGGGTWPAELRASFMDS